MLIVAPKLHITNMVMYFTQDLLKDDCLFGQTLQALVTPPLLPGFLVAASKKAWSWP